MKRASKFLRGTISAISAMVVAGFAVSASAQTQAEQEAIEELVMIPEEEAGEEVDLEEVLAPVQPFEDRYPLGTWIPIVDDPRTGDPYPGVIPSLMEEVTSPRYSEDTLGEGPFGVSVPLIVVFAWEPVGVEE